MKILCEILHGSRLYGLDHKDSDFDYKLIGLPDIRDCLLNEAPKNIIVKNEALKSTFETYSLTEFFKHAREGESYVMDMLHAPIINIIKSSELWNYIIKHRSRFYTKSMRGSVGYCKSQAGKYALKSERLNAAKKVVDFLKEKEKNGIVKVNGIWDELPDGEHTSRGINEKSRNEDKRYYEVSGKKITPGISIDYAISIYENLINSFGERVKQAALLDEKDLKSICHSFRVGYQLRHIYKNGSLVYPMPETNFLRSIRFREFTISFEDLQFKLNDLITEVEELSIQSSLPDKVDKSWLDEIVLNAYQVSGEFL